MQHRETAFVARNGGAVVTCERDRGGLPELSQKTVLRCNATGDLPGSEHWLWGVPTSPPASQATGGQLMTACLSSRSPNIPPERQPAPPVSISSFLIGALIGLVGVAVLMMAGVSGLFALAAFPVVSILAPVLFGLYGFKKEAAKRAANVPPTTREAGSRHSRQ